MNRTGVGSCVGINTVTALAVNIGQRSGLQATVFGWVRDKVQVNRTECTRHFIPCDSQEIDALQMRVHIHHDFKKVNLYLISINSNRYSLSRMIENYQVKSWLRTLSWIMISTRSLVSLQKLRYIYHTANSFFLQYIEDCSCSLIAFIWLKNGINQPRCSCSVSTIILSLNYATQLSVDKDRTR